MPTLTKSRGYWLVLALSVVGGLVWLLAIHLPLHTLLDFPCLIAQHVLPHDIL